MGLVQPQLSLIIHHVIRLISWSIELVYKIKELFCFQLEVAAQWDRSGVAFRDPPSSGHPFPHKLNKWRQTREDFEMADLEAVLADVSYLMAMEKSKCTPAARASKKIVLPDPRWVLVHSFVTHASMQTQFLF